MSALPDVELRTAGHCVHPEHVVLRTGTLRPARFPATFAVISHAKAGVILVDTGYAPHFHAATEPFPERLYRWLTPVTAGFTAREQLEQRGVHCEDVRVVIATHLHGDHIAGLRDFPRARIVVHPAALADLARPRVERVRRGVLTALLPEDFAQRALLVDTKPLVPLSADYAPFTRAFDLLGDRTVLAVPLPGHADGQLGVIVEDAAGVRWFFIADAAWSSRAVREQRAPHPVTRLLFASWDTYLRTLRELSALHERAPELRLVPSHCEETERRYGVAQDGR